ncbi:MAG TPA: hypothetical protein EYP41_15125 [Anaerolineae bacterium]|nr:hypothetical protein [Anaerolineae bacterium]
MSERGVNIYSWLIILMFSYHRRLILLGLLVLLLSACLPAAPPSNLPDFPTPQPLGLSPAKPLPPGQLIQTDNWTIEVRQFLRGEAAWKMLAAANSNNEPLPAGEEYVLIQFHLQNNSADPEEKSIGLALTGSRRVRYNSFDARVVTPQPYLQSSLPGGGEMDGWYAYRVGQGETDLLLVVDNYEDEILYAALTENAAVIVPVAELSAIQATDLGQSLAAAAPYKEPVTTTGWQVRVTDVVQGDTAWEMVREANQFNDPPPDGMMYVAVKLWARYIGLNEDGESIDEFMFDLANERGKTWERPSVVPPLPDLTRHLYPGGETEGWLVLTAPADGRNLILVFTPHNRSETRYLSLLEYGR